MNKPLDENTSDEDMELANFLTGLFTAKIISRKQGRTLLQMLTESGSATGAVPSSQRGDPNIGRHFGSFIAEQLIGACAKRGYLS